MSTITRAEILRVFKALHRASHKTFRGDDEVLVGMREGINKCFKESKAETNSEVIRKLYNDAVTIEDEIRTKILQVKEVAPGQHKLTIEPEHCFKVALPRKRCCGGHEEHSKAEQSKSEKL